VDAYDFTALCTFKAQLSFTSFAPASAQHHWRWEPKLSTRTPETEECTVASVTRLVRTAYPAPHKPVAQAETLSITNTIYLALLNPSDCLWSSCFPLPEQPWSCCAVTLGWCREGSHLLFRVGSQSRSVLRIQAGGDHRKYHVWLYCCISQDA